MQENRRVGRQRLHRQDQSHRRARAIGGRLHAAALRRLLRAWTRGDHPLVVVTRRAGRGELLALTLRLVLFRLRFGTDPDSRAFVDRVEAALKQPPSLGCHLPSAVQGLPRAARHLPLFAALPR